MRYFMEESVLIFVIASVSLSASILPHSSFGRVSKKVFSVIAKNLPSQPPGVGVIRHVLCRFQCSAILEVSRTLARYLNIPCTKILLIPLAPGQPFTSIHRSFPRAARYY